MAISGSPEAGKSGASGAASSAAAAAGSERIARSRSATPAITCACIVPAPGTSTSTCASGTILPSGEGSATACRVVTASPFPSSVPVPCVSVSSSCCPPSVVTGVRPRTSMTVPWSLSAMGLKASAGSVRSTTAARAPDAAAKATASRRAFMGGVCPRCVAGSLLQCFGR